MATTLTIGSPKRLALGTTTEAVTIPRNARYLRIEALAHDVVLAVTGTDGGALAADQLQQQLLRTAEQISVRVFCGACFTARAEQLPIGSTCGAGAQ